MSWDQVGLVSGDPASRCAAIHFAVDPTLAVIEEAARSAPTCWSPTTRCCCAGVHSVATTGAKGAAVTAWSSATSRCTSPTPTPTSPSPGVSDALAAACGLTDVEPLAVVRRTAAGLGRVGDLAEPLTLREFAARLSAALPPAAGRASGSAGPATPRVQRVAVMRRRRRRPLRRRARQRRRRLRHRRPAPPPGAGGREEARGGPPYLVDAGHWASEWLWLAGARRPRLAALLRRSGGTLGGGPHLHTAHRPLGLRGRRRTARWPGGTS